MNNVYFTKAGLLYGLCLVFGSLHTDSADQPCPAVECSQPRCLERHVIGRMVRRAVQGEWYLWTREDERLVCYNSVTVSGMSFILDGADRHEGIFMINPVVSPKTIDISFTGGPHKGLFLQGIYRLNGGSGRVNSLADQNIDLCIACPGQPRPVNFVGQDNACVALTLFR